MRWDPQHKRAVVRAAWSLPARLTTSVRLKPISSAKPSPVSISLYTRSRHFGILIPASIPIPSMIPSLTFSCTCIATQSHMLYQPQMNFISCQFLVSHLLFHFFAHGEGKSLGGTSGSFLVFWTLRLVFFISFHLTNHVCILRVSYMSYTNYIIIIVGIDNDGCLFGKEADDERSDGVGGVLCASGVI